MFRTRPLVWLLMKKTSEKTHSQTEMTGSNLSVPIFTSFL